MKRFFTFIFLIVVTLGLMLLTTIMLDIVFIQAHIIRQLIIHILLVIELIIGAKAFLVLYKKQK